MIRVWSMHSPDFASVELEPPSDLTVYMTSAVFSPDGTRLFTGGNSLMVNKISPHLYLRDAQSGAIIGPRLRCYNQGLEFRCVVFSADSSLLAIGSSNGSIQLMDARTFEDMKAPIMRHSGTVNSMAFSPDGTLLVSGGDDKVLSVWSIPRGRKFDGAFKGHTGRVLCVSFSPDGKQIASGVP